MEEPNNVGGGAVVLAEMADPAGAGAGAGAEAIASPWSKNTPPPAAGEAAVMGATSWPALGEARQKRASESPAKAGARNAAPTDSVKSTRASPRPPPSQGSSRTHKFDGHGNFNKNQQAQNKNGPKRRFPPANGAPSYPSAIHYHQHPGQPMFYPVLPGPIILHEYPYPPYAVADPNHGRPVGKPGYDNSVPPLVPLDKVGVNEGNRLMPQHRRGDPHAWRPPVGTHGARPHPGPEGHGHFSHNWRNHQIYGTRGSTNLPRGSGPRASVRAIAPPLGFINGPWYPGAMHPMYCYMTPVPMEPMRGPPHYVKNQSVPYPVLSPEAAELRSNILTQVEYYFSDVNLEHDQFLKSLMDEHGWIPVAKIADFNRLRKMTTDVQLILDALASSTLLEVQDDKIRSSDWSKWIPFSGTSTASPLCAITDGSMDERSASGFLNKDACLEDSKRHCDSRDVRSNEDYVSMEAKGAEEHLAQDVHSYSLKKDFSAMTIDEKPKTSSALPMNLHKHESSFRSGEIKVQKVNSKINVPGAPSERCFSSGLPSNFSSFSGDQSTFLLDEELEMEHVDHAHDDHYSQQGVDDEEDDFFFYDQDINGLIIVTQGIHHYRKSESDPVTKHPELDKLLRQEFQTLEDFRAKEKSHESAGKESGAAAVEAEAK